MPALTNKKYEAYCLHYMRLHDKRAAAIAAGYSPASAHVTGCEIFKRPEVRERIAELTAEYLAEVQLDAGRVLREMVTAAFTGLDAFTRVNGDGDPYVDMTEATPEQIRTLTEITVDDVIKDRKKENKNNIRKVKIKAGDRMKALERLWGFVKLAEPEKQTEASAFANASAQLARTGSAMPIKRDD